MQGASLGLLIATTILQLLAVFLFIRAIRETRETTIEVQKTTTTLRDVQASINMQSEAMYLSQLWFKWSSPEIRRSINFGLRLGRADARSLWEGVYHDKGREVADEALEVPRFFDDLVGNLLILGTIHEETALANFGFNADHYWKRFRPLIDLLREDSTWGFYRFDNFERFAGKAKQYLAKREVGKP